MSHVLPADPRNFWVFERGQTKLLADNGGSKIQLTCECFFTDRAFFSFTYKGREVGRLLEMDEPFVILNMPDGAPAVTLTLRSIGNGTASLQISANPGLGSRRADG
jgi:hypothetical protein